MMGGRLARGAMRTGDSCRDERAARARLGESRSRRGELLLDEVPGRLFCSFRGGVCCAWTVGCAWDSKSLLWNCEPTESTLRRRLKLAERW